MNNGRGWTPYDATLWLYANRFHAHLMFATEGQWRFRQFEPAEGAPDTFRTVEAELPLGIQAVVVDVLT